MTLTDSIKTQNAVGNKVSPLETNRLVYNKDFARFKTYKMTSPYRLIVSNRFCRVPDL